MKYYFNVSNLYLSCTNSRKQIVSDSVNFHTAKFTLDSDWQGYNIKAIFTNSKDNTLSVEQLLDINNECAIPSSPISVDGNLVVKLVGEKVNSRIETTMINDLVILLSSVGNGNEDIIFTPSIVQQLTELINGKGDNLTYSNSILKLLSGTTELSSVTISGGGGDAREVELRNNGTYIQWHYVGELVWYDLVALTDLKGDKGDDGVGIESITKVSTVGLIDNYRITFTDNNTFDYSVNNGEDGNGIQSIAKISTVGLIDTYEITYTDNTTSQYTVTNGANGNNGRGIAYISLVGTIGLVDQYRITFDDGTQTNYNVTNGAKGDTGKGISDITLTSSLGLVDTYTITYTDLTTTTFTVTNGKDGLTTSVEVNGTIYNQSGGKITLPNLEPMLPISPTIDPQLKFLNANKEWVDISLGSLSPQGILDATSSGTITKELVRNIPIKISTALTSLTLTYPTTYYWYDTFTIIFKSTALTLPSGVVWHDGTSPTIDGNKWYELSIRDNRAVLSGGVA
jgi:hypothetical protein